METRRLVPLAIGASLTWSFSTASTAAPICPIDKCEPNWDAGCHSVCVPVTVAGKTTRVCDIDDNDESTTLEADKDGIGIAIYDDSDPSEVICEGAPYCAWGSTTSGTQFYCEWGTEGDSLAAVHLKGGAANDHLSFLCEEGTNPGYSVYMQEWSGYDLSSAFVGQISGWSGNDEILGSRRDSTDYEDRVYAGPGADDVSTFEGPDYVEGSGHADRICTGPGDDGVVAGDGANIVCTQTGVDSIVAGSQDDTLYSGTETDSIAAGGGTDTCDNYGAESVPTCEISVDPNDCDGSDTGTPVECPQ